MTVTESANCRGRTPSQRNQDMTGSCGKDHGMVVSDGSQQWLHTTTAARYGMFEKLCALRAEAGKTCNAKR